LKNDGCCGCKVLGSFEQNSGVEHLRHKQSNDQSDASDVSCCLRDSEGCSTMQQSKEQDVLPGVEQRRQKLAWMEHR